MENEYENIMSLVEEVRDILESSEELQEKAKHPKGWKGPKSFSKKMQAQNPFKGLKKGKKTIGTGPGPRKRKLTRRAYWACNCKGTKKTGGAMSVCHCLGKEGEHKTVTIKGAYKNAYNKRYRKWRKTQKKFKGGKASPFKPRA